MAKLDSVEFQKIIGVADLRLDDDYECSYESVSASDDEEEGTSQFRRNDSLIKAKIPDRRVGNILSEVPVLAALNNDERQQLGASMREATFQSGQAVFRQGEVGTRFYIISEGKAMVSKEENGQTHQLAVLNPGDYFGETALINSAPRGATVTAKGMLCVLSLAKEDFKKLFGEKLRNVNFVKRDAVSAETLSRSVGGGQEKGTVFDKIQPPPDAVRNKDPKLLKKLKKAIGKTILFNDMDDAHQEEVVRAMYRVEVKKGTDVITQGELGSNVYCVEKGKLDVLLKRPGHKKLKKIASKGTFKCFGELALLYNAPRSATVKARKDCVLWVVDRYTFRRIAKNVSKAKLRMYTEFLRRVPLLQPLAAYERSKIAEALEEVRFAGHSVVFKQHDRGDCVYIVKSGEVLISKHQEQADKRARPSVLVNRIKVGGYFGERALLTNEPRAASVRVGEHPVVLLKLDREGFNLLLGPLKDIMNRTVQNYVGYEQAAKDAGIVQGKEPRLSRTPKKDESIKFRNLKIIGVLGKGSFGFVQLVKDRTTNKKYALKAVSKQQVVDTQQQGHIMSEKNTMLSMKHPMLIELFTTFKDQHYLYFVLEPSLGGELFVVLRNARQFNEATSQFYAASVLLAFEYMHSLDTVYRDLKPENLLLDAKGFLKVTDFGFAKVLPENQRAYTLCGTPEYLAPELVSGKGHGKGVDWWTLGILIFEMLAGYTPFYHQDHLKMYELIARGKYRYPSHFSTAARHVIDRLLEHNPSRRYGVVQGGAETIKKSKWFAKFDFDGLINQKLQPPIVPKLAGDEDVSNFADYAKQKANALEYRDDGTNWDADF